MRKDRGRRRFLYAVPCAALVGSVWTALVTLLTRDDEPLPQSRSLLAADDALIECIPSGIDAFPGDFLTQEQRRGGGVVAHVIIVCYVCAMTAVVCDEYFVPALEAIADRLKLPPDVAGATFMAMGASAPELFSSIAGSFVTEDDIGLGTILGSAVFNILGISGIVGLVRWKQALTIEWYPVVRDCIVYGTTVLVLTYIIFDNIVRWWEALLLVVIFCSYIVFMNFNARVEKNVHRLVSSCSGRQKNPEKAPLLDAEKGAATQLPQVEDIDEAAVVVDPQRKWCLSCWHVVMWLPSLLFRLTIPPVKWYPATFAVSIAWMGGLSYIAVWMVTIIGYTFSIPDSVSGLTLLAAGSSVPDLIATVVIAKSGKGNMAISNLLGSNTFDLAFCLGAPWLVKTLTSGGGRFLVYSSAMIYTVSTLFATLFALLLTFHLNRWRLDRISGSVCLSLYFAFITLACLYELNVFGEINKPTCPST